MSKINYHDGVTVETEVKQFEDFDSFNETNYQFFGLSEKGIQTELTMRDINEIDIENKELKEKKLLEQKIPIKTEPKITNEEPQNNNIKKDINNKLNEHKINNNANNLIDKLIL